MKIFDGNLRLVLYEKLTSFKARPQIAFEYKLTQCTCCPACGVKLICVTTLLFRTIKCCARTLQKCCCITTVMWIKTDPNAVGNTNLLVFIEEWLNECFSDSVRRIGCVLCTRNLC